MAQHQPTSHGAGDLRANSLPLKRMNRWSRILRLGMSLSMLLALVASFNATPVAAATAIDTLSGWNGSDYIWSFGIPDTATYGQVITVPASDPVLQSFTFKVNLPSTLAFQAEVYAWNGTRATSTNLYESPPLSTSGSGYQNVTVNTGGITLTPGARYVLFLSCSKLFPGHSGGGNWAARSSNPYAGGNMVYINNGADPAQRTSGFWNDYGQDLAFSASFTGAILPNNPPINTVPGAQSTVLNTALVFSSANSNAISIADADSGGDEQVTLTATNGTLALGTTAGLTSVTGNGTSSVVAKGTLAALNTALAGLAFTPTNNYVGSANLTITTDDLGNNGGPAKSDTDSVAITVDKGNQTISFTDPGSKTYGDANFTLSATASSSLPVSFSYLSGPATLVGNIVTITGAGTINVRASQSGNASYNAAPNVDRAIIVSPAPLSISADDKVKYINTANPPLTATYNGFVNGEDATVLDTPVNLTTTALTNSPLGDYPITASSAADTNYAISFVPGTLTVTAKQVPAITWANPVAISYGTALGGTQLNATANVPGTFSYTPASGTVLHVGNNQSLSVDFTPTDTDTYASVSKQVSIDVNPVALTITAADATKTYGAGLPSFTASSTGLVNGDTLANLDTPLELSTTALPTSSIGDYPITPNASDSDYTITLVAGKLTVTPASLVITADNKTKYVDTPNPTLTASYNGFVNGDDQASLVPPVSLVTTALLNSPIGDYPITASGAVNPNYTISFAPGILTVTAKQVPVITWSNPAAITYGTALGATQLNATTSVPGTFSYTPASGTVLNAGNSQTLSVDFTPTDTDTYVGVSKQVTIDVLPKALTITATDATKVYGAGLPTFTASAVGLVNGDTLANLDTPLDLSSTASAASNTGSYSIAVNAADANYTITLVNGTLTVTPAALTITADNKIKHVGTANPTLTASYSGFVNGDDETSLVPPVSLVTTALLNSPIGDYPITASGAVNPNYTISFAPGILTVTAKQVPVITWSNPAAITYGAALGATQLNATTSVPGTFSYTPASGTVLNAGNSQTLSVTFTPTDSGNYASVGANVSISVLRAALTIKANDKQRVVGAANPTLTVTYSGFVNGDTEASLDTPATLSTSATKSSLVGTYPIIVSGASDTNYAITFTNGTLTITNYQLYIPTILAPHQATK